MITVKSARPADAGEDNTRPISRCSIDDLARHQCSLSRCALAASILQRRTGDCGAVVDRGR